MKKIFAFTWLLLAAFHASAEKADSLKQARLDADSAEADEVSQTRTLTGNVVLTRGTLIMKSDKAVLKESPDGYNSVTLTSNAGKMATFRQKKDGGPDLWVEGQAKRIEYEERTDMVKLFNNATVKNLEGTRLSNQTDGEFISYDSRKDVALARNDASGESKSGSGRVTLILAPRKPVAASATAPATTPPAPATAAPSTPATPASPAADKK